MFSSVCIWVMFLSHAFPKEYAKAWKCTVFLLYKSDIEMQKESTLTQLTFNCSKWPTETVEKMWNILPNNI